MTSLWYSMVCLVSLVDLTFAQALSPDALRRSLSVDPVSSHMRDRIVPQNVNILMSSLQSVPSNVQSNGIIVSPQKAEGMVRSSVVDIVQPMVEVQPVLQEQRIIQQISPIQVVQQPARQPVRQMTLQLASQLSQQPLPQVAPQPAPQIAFQPVSQLTQQPVPKLVQQPVPQLVQQPVRQVLPQPLPQIPPQPVPQSAPQRATVLSDVIRRSLINDRLLNNTSTVDTSSSPVGCSFQIPSFLLPGPDTTQPGSAPSCPSFLLPGPTINPELITVLSEHWTGVKKDTANQFNDVRSRINQVEFEQKCLLPALRAHVMGSPACRTREMAVYLEWLLYLRERLFNI